MGEFASKGVAGTALGFGIGATALTLLNNNGCGNGLLGGLFGGNNNCHVTKDEFAFALANQEKMANKDAEIAFYKGQDITNGNIIATYKELNGEIIKRDTVIAGLAQEVAVNRERIDCLNGKVTDLQVTQGLQSANIAELNTQSAVNGEKLTHLARTTTARFETQSQEFYTALNCAIDKERCYVDANFVKGEIKLPITSICPLPAEACEVTTKK